MKPWMKIAITSVLILSFAGICTTLYLLKLGHRDLQKADPDFIITAAELQKAFEDSEISATKKYVNRIIEVSGIIESVNKGEEDVFNVTLNTGSDFSSVICTFPDATNSANFISSGNRVTIRGECSGYLMDVLLNNCVLIK